MKIIKAGQYKQATKRFECPNCGCLFEADDTEYVSAGQLDYVFNGVTASCKCPFCKTIVDAHK